MLQCIACSCLPHMFYIPLVIGASVSEPHTSKFNGGISLSLSIYIYMYIYMYCTLYVQCTRMHATCGQKACDLTCANLVLLPVENMDIPNTSRWALKPSEDKEDRLQHRREQEKPRRVAETAKERQERLVKRRERDRAEVVMSTSRSPPQCNAFL